MDNVNFHLPIDSQYRKNELEGVITAIFGKLIDDNFAAGLKDLFDYGAPYLGSPTVVERFTKQDGLAVLRRPDTSAKLMKIIYANWSSLATKRGLAFLEFVLQMLWPQQWSIIRLYHPIPQINQYPDLITTIPKPTRFLTSRVRIILDESIDHQELSELSPILKRLVPAHVVPSIAVNLEPSDTENVRIGLAMIGQHFADHTPTDW